ncbi:MAG TPA: hypothetical protein DCQ32_04655 [Cyanobacteria bacterium UBA8156]|nr:hypothetical protein [Cyanobacteria bacterium UBA8156]
MSFCSLVQKPERATQRAANSSISGTARRQDWEQRLQGYPAKPSGQFFPIASHRSAPFASYPGAHPGAHPGHGLG